MKNSPISSTTLQESVDNSYLLDVMKLASQKADEELIRLISLQEDLLARQLSQTL